MAVAGATAMLKEPLVPPSMGVVQRRAVTPTAASINGPPEGLDLSAEVSKSTEQQVEGEPTRQSKFTTLMVANKDGLGTIQGVFVPCMLSIVGLVLFMRLGWAVGEAGVLGVLSMIAFGCTLIALTVFSLCALATNGKIRGGG
jgi:hypothetical protein